MHINTCPKSGFRGHVPHGSPEETGSRPGRGRNQDLKNCPDTPNYLIALGSKALEKTCPYRYLQVLVLHSLTQFHQIHLVEVAKDLPLPMAK